ncbi:cell division protein FtsA [Tepidibacillus sp. HK-1]|uniref:cell division protein FtsA n=1 Tax=Tepidibacillus sp. HK-1 TaxID=1883407 RepID=UPI000852A920|nr:cell division protein FtsA [Tepidibacillus sp. HK-1]GBF10392.1 cell division protein FtsA [Tepidibacillus sp. HK-1]
MEQHLPIFALDIGTRTVVGLILVPTKEGQFEIKDLKMIEHRERSMLDGQIHDVVAVSEIISQVKKELEQNNGPLHNVAVAAAGRSLKTRRVKLDISIQGQPLLRKEDIRALELSAVQEAQRQIATESQIEDTTHYHCVGYSVINYFLDDQIIGNLIDQRGQKATVEIIATFLPRVVVDSLLSSLTRAELGLEALTLEPIAAIHVLIPPSMRKLNLALVDIGAGTSDIAITAEGTIIAYGMVPVAGDEITEAISQSYILDFHIAEEIKRQCSTQETVHFSDILGMSYTLNSSELIEQIDQEIEQLATQIANKIIELNGGKSPQAVMLVGGGSQTPKLSDKIATILNLPRQRVAVRGADAIQQPIIWPKNLVKGPELITPIGIGISSRQNPIQYFTIEVNGEFIHLFEMKTLTIGDVLIAAGISIKSLYGRPGLAMTVNINGQMKIIPGEHGTLPEILLNEVPATMDTQVANGDKIEVKAGKNGKNATLTLDQALLLSPIRPYQVTIDGKLLELPVLVEINGIDVDFSTPISDRDSIVFHSVRNIEEALILSGFSTIPFEEKIIQFIFQGEPRKIVYVSKDLFRNGKKVLLKEPIAGGDVITFAKETNPYPTIRDLMNENPDFQWGIDVIFNGKPVHIQPSSLQVLINNKKNSVDSPIEQNSDITIHVEDQQIVFSDVFRYVEFDTTPPSGASKFVIKVNGEEGDFNTPIKQGDQLELYWE